MLALEKLFQEMFCNTNLSSCADEPLMVLMLLKVSFTMLPPFCLLDIPPTPPEASSLSIVISKPSTAKLV